MTTKDYHEKETSDKTLDDLYRLGVSIEEKVEDILEELRDLGESHIAANYQGYDWRDFVDENNDY